MPGPSYIPPHRPSPATAMPALLSLPSWLPSITPKKLRRRPSKAAPATPSLATPTEEAAGARRMELREVFGRFDADGDGKVSAAELRAYLQGLGEEVSEEEVEAAVRQLDGDGDGLVDFEDFGRLMERAGEGIMRRAFEMFEEETGEGRITARGLQRALARLGDHTTSEECAAMIRAFDVDGDGVLNFQDFYRMMA